MISRREFLLGSASIAGTGRASRIVDLAHAADPAGCGTLDDIEHVVLLMQENRSFDHYFGTLSSVRGFDDPHAPKSIFQQTGFAPGTGVTPTGFIEPFRLDTTNPKINGQCLNDPVHDWAAQHACWNDGHMDAFVRTHVATDGETNGPAVMGYYTRKDIPLHYELADAFTICDYYFSSVMGPTAANRLYWMSATLDPDGTGGGPLVEIPTPPSSARLEGLFTWPTYPETLQEAGVTWKLYQSAKVLQQVGTGVYFSNVLSYFHAYRDENTPLFQNGMTPTFPDDFERDVANGTLPQVSWLLVNPIESEHPGSPPGFGEHVLADVLRTLVSNPSVWEKSALIVSYDENGGFFDHVPPPTAPPGTPGEYLTVDLATVRQANGIAGPIGLGCRAPALVISPFSRGGLVCSDVFDHTSQLRLIERRFGVPVPNVSAWRRANVGDMTGAFNFGAPADMSVPDLPAPSLLDPTILQQCDLGLNDVVANVHGSDPYPLPSSNQMPTQETTPVRARPSGPVAPCGATSASTPSASTPSVVSTPRGSDAAWQQPVIGVGAAGAAAVFGALVWLRRRRSAYSRQ